MNRLRKWRQALKPPPRMTVSEWAEKYQMLPSDSAEPGKYRVSRVPYMAEVMNSFSMPNIKRIAVKSASQSGKSAVLLNILGYYAHLNPCTIMLIQPTLFEAEDFSKSRLQKMIRDCKVLTPLFYENETAPTILSKFFKGGRVILVGANSAGSLASRPIKILLCDEVDRYPVSVDGEGDPVDLAAKRTTTFFDAKVGLFSTPTTEGMSRIDLEYYQGTQEEWQHECPNCGEYHYLNHEQMETDYAEAHDETGIRFIKVKSTKWRCPDCGLKFGEREMRDAPQKYVAKNSAALENGIRTFSINGFSSPWLRWDEIMREWLEAQGNPAREAVVMNTRFGQSYKAKVTVDEDTEKEMASRLEEYGAEIPVGALMLTAGVDVQSNRLHYAVYGFGLNEEIWGIEYGVLYGAPQEKNVWHKLDEVLEKVRQRADGAEIKIARTFIDSGFSTDNVYEYVRHRPNRYAIKGLGSAGTAMIHKVTSINGMPLIILGTNDCKNEVYGRLEKIHYGKDDVMARNFDEVFFRELTSEHRVRRKRGGGLVEVYELINEHRRNEALDVTCYALAAMKSLMGNRSSAEFWRDQVKSPRNVVRHREMDIWGSVS